MPEISGFFGIIIRMFAEVGAPHHRPHFHAVCQDSQAIIALDPVECIDGGLPRTQQRLVEAWAEIHREEYWPTELSCNPAGHRSRLNRCVSVAKRRGLRS